ncbi:hypothetical protein EX895_001301 [Sporisorium graminicola]|uniref:Signal transduction histidine kinase dimerisation/phosphoacceptor domain-containing protein n=1 Tax=Sporisorium graminicola TaxID=280036 RepID=A0A4U7KZ01_9BASI|nr:hypothetical protein EX895_001301 [Sporisorium graminicola]TKY90003.1 hypothetical protein EX895_001301 [Sporisorium graminicola]
MQQHATSEPSSSRLSLPQVPIEQRDCDYGPDQWAHWLREYQLGAWSARTAPAQPPRLTPHHSPSNALKNTDRDKHPSFAKEEGTREVPTRTSPANSTSTPPKLSTTDPQRSPTTQTDQHDADHSWQFFRDNGWLPAPPLRDQHRSRLRKALIRHRLTAPQQRPALRFYVQHARAVFRCSSASIMVESPDATCMLILARDGGDTQVQTMPRESSLCSHAMLLADDQVLVVDNAEQDWRFSALSSSPLGCATLEGKPTCFYASAPFLLSDGGGGVKDGAQVGRLCIMDEHPRYDFGDADVRILSDIAMMASKAIEHEYDSTKSIKVAEMQQRTSNLIRMVENGVLMPKPVDPDRAILTKRISAHGLHVMAMPLNVMGRACVELKDCLGAAAVAAFDVSSIPCGEYDDGLPLGSSAVTMVSFSGPDRLRPRTIEPLLLRRDVFANALRSIDARADSQNQCKFYERGSSQDESSDTASGGASGCSEGHLDPCGELLPPKDQVPFYAVCVCHNPKKQHWTIMFLVAFAEMPDFGRQEHLFIEAVSQIASASLLPRQLAGLALLKSEFLSHVQHQLRTPLRTALGAVDHLRNAIDQTEGGAGNAALDLSPDGTLATMLDSIAGSAQTLNAYLNDLLSFQNENTLRTSEHVVVDIVSMVEAIADEEWENAQRLRPQPDTSSVAESVELIVRCTPELRHSQWLLDARTLETAIRKVIATAAHVTRSGYIEVIVRLAHGGVFRAIEPSRGNSNLSIEVEVLSTSNSTANDTAATVLTHAFGITDPFYRDFALNMALVSCMLKRCGGRLSVSSHVERKNSMRICLPVQHEPSPHVGRDPTSSILEGRFAVKTVAFYDMETEGLKRLATCIWDHLSSVANLVLTEDFKEADCIILPEVKASDVDQRWETMLSQSKSDSRFVLIRSSYLVQQKQVDSLSGRATLPFGLPHGPSSFWLLETFLSDGEPMPIYTMDSAHERRQRLASFQGQSSGNKLPTDPCHPGTWEHGAQLLSRRAHSHDPSPPQRIPYIRTRS